MSSYEHTARLGSQKVAELPNILLVNSLWDPSTSITWKKALRLQIPNYFLFAPQWPGSTCLSDLWRDTLGDGRILSNGKTTCVRYTIRLSE